MHSSVYIFSISFRYLQYCLPSAWVHNRQLVAARPIDELVVDKELQICSSHIQCKADSQYHGSSLSPFSAEPALQRALQHTCLLQPDLHAVPDIGWLYMHPKQSRLTEHRAFDGTIVFYGSGSSTSWHCTTKA
jgi:hypothetical protein